MVEGSWVEDGLAVGVVDGRKDARVASDGVPEQGGLLWGGTTAFLGS